MKRNNQYTTMVEAVSDLAKRGYSHNFSISNNSQLIEGNQYHFYPFEVELHEFHRFEGNTNPDDMSIVYAVKTINGMKGTVVDSFGVQGSEVVSEFMNKVVQKQFDS